MRPPLSPPINVTADKGGGVTLRHLPLYKSPPHLLLVPYRLHRPVSALLTNCSKTKWRCIVFYL